MNLSQPALTADLVAYLSQCLDLLDVSGDAMVSVDFCYLNEIVTLQVVTLASL